MVGRGPNKMPLKGVKVGHGKYVLGNEQKLIHNLSRKVQRYHAKVNRLNHETKILQTSVEKLTVDLLQNNAKYFKRASMWVCGWL